MCDRCGRRSDKLLMDRTTFGQFRFFIGDSFCLRLQSHKCYRYGVSKLSRRNRAMNGLTEEAVIAPGDMGCDQFPLAASQGALVTQQEVHQFIDGRGCLGPKSHQP